MRSTPPYPNGRAKLHEWAMDLANNPEDRLATHSLVVTLKRRPNPPNQSLYFKMHHGDVMTRERFLARLDALGQLNDEVAAAINEQRTNDTAQITVICEGLIRFLYFTISDGGVWLRQRDPAFSRALAQDWERDLIEAIDTGRPAALEIHSSRALERLALQLDVVTIIGYL